MTEFWKDQERLHRLAGIIAEDEDEDREEEELNALYDHEKQVERHVLQVFKELGIPVTDGPVAVLYDTISKEVNVILDDQPGGFSIKQLAGLYRSGMGDDYRIENHDDIHLQVTFKWNAV